MSSHVYHEIYLHLNWHVKDDKATLTSELEPIVHQTISDRIHRTNGVWLHGINGTETHIHIAINLERTICLGFWSTSRNRKSTMPLARRLIEWKSVMWMKKPQLLLQQLPQSLQAHEV